MHTELELEKDYMSKQDRYVDFYDYLSSRQLVQCHITGEYGVLGLEVSYLPGDDEDICITISTRHQLTYYIAKKLNVDYDDIIMEDNDALSIKIQKDDAISDFYLFIFYGEDSNTRFEKALEYFTSEKVV